MKKKTLVLGASLKPNRYSNYAIQRLVANEFEVVAFGLKKGEISGIVVDDELMPYRNLHTVTLYLNPKRQEDYYNYVVLLKPERVIFNPGTENPKFYKILKENNIPFEAACTLVLLATDQY
ncbi:CoA-binding protein [Flavivirga spongiicola]|uniref:CoA-binding protein n=1 Tax=Flavivirga spongiicola TaxID=421621 RepID=A0ABU7XMJ0_9FLAO|nr:CoA-binding protein [Flavivirga sp. MEBiC05379]MDO5981627.1 CoA-binding protein [Flavivirga sp. MEBiC05379]